SSADQNLARQVEDLKDFGCDRIIEEKQSGKNFSERPEYNRLRNQLRFHDVLVVHDLSRFGRNKQEIKDEWEFLTKKEIDIVVLNMPILDTRKYKDLEGVGQLITDIVLSLLSWMVEEERQRIRTAQKEGIAIAKREGKYKGRKPKYSEDATGKDKLIYDTIIDGLNNNVSVMDIHKKTGVARST